jgi:hypothetical protein
MQTAKRCPPSAPAHPSAETVAAAWVMVVILLGSIFFAIACLLHRIGG